MPLAAFAQILQALTNFLFALLFGTAPFAGVPASPLARHHIAGSKLGLGGVHTTKTHLIPRVIRVFDDLVTARESPLECHLEVSHVRTAVRQAQQQQR